MIAFRMGFRIVGMLVMALALAHCGGGGGGDNGSSDGDSPPPGTFSGRLSDGGAIRLEVGSIEAIAFTCNGTAIQETFSPPQPINDDGSFGVEFTDGGRTFQVRGTFIDDDHVSGSIDDADDACDASFDATRGVPPITPTPVITPTSSGGLTPTATATVTPTGPITIPTELTITPTLTPTPTPTPTGDDLCPVALEVVGVAGSAKVLDTGWTGIAQNQTIVDGGKLTFTITGCDNPGRPCGVCDVGGPIQNANADKGDINAHRCSNNTTIRCDNDAACTAPGKCVFYFGAPLPLSAGGISTCVTNQLNGNVTGTTDIEAGAFASNLTLTARVFSGIQQDQPCPVCAGDSTVNDGIKGGTCTGGPSNGAACDGNGRSPVAAFGTTSFDCPPTAGAFIAALPIGLNGSSGTEKVTLSATSPPCSDALGKKCFCPADGGTTRPNACIDSTIEPGDGTICAAESATEGRCPQGPVDLNCKIETFLGCKSDQDCMAPGDSCVAANRPCYLDNGAIGGSVSAIGMADPPTNGQANPTLAALFCVGKTNASSVNAVAGLPGLGRIELPLSTKQIEQIAP